MKTFIIIKLLLITSLFACGNLCQMLIVGTLLIATSLVYLIYINRPVKKRKSILFEVNKNGYLKRITND